MSELKYSGLSAACKHLVRVMQQNPYCRIEHLAVVNGEPVFANDTKIIAEMKFGNGDGARPESGLPDYVLKKEVTELLKQLNQIGSGELLALEIRHGLPFRMSREIAA